MSWQEGWQAIVDRVLPKCNTKLNHGDKVLGKIEKNSFIALLGKGGGSEQARAFKTVSHPEGDGEGS